MEITEEHQRHIEAIKRQMKCPMDFKCQELGFTYYPSVECFGELLECLEEEAQYCPFSLPFDIGHFCQCPLNNYVHRQLKIAGEKQRWAEEHALLIGRRFEQWQKPLGINGNEYLEYLTKELIDYCDKPLWKALIESIC